MRDSISLRLSHGRSVGYRECLHHLRLPLPRCPQCCSVLHCRRSKRPKNSAQAPRLGRVQRRQYRVIQAVRNDEPNLRVARIFRVQKQAHAAGAAAANHDALIRWCSC